MCTSVRKAPGSVSLVSVEMSWSARVPLQALRIASKMAPDPWMKPSAAQPCHSRSLLLLGEPLQPEREGTTARITKWEMSKCHGTKSIAWSQSCFSAFPVSDLCVRVTPGLLYLLHPFFPRRCAANAAERDNERWCPSHQTGPSLQSAQAERSGPAGSSGCPGAGQPPAHEDANLASPPASSSSLAARSPHPPPPATLPCRPPSSLHPCSAPEERQPGPHPSPSPLTILIGNAQQAEAFLEKQGQVGRHMVAVL